MIAKRLIFIALFIFLITASICKASMMKFHIYLDSGIITFDGATDMYAVPIDFIALYDTQDVTDDNPTDNIDAVNVVIRNYEYIVNGTSYKDYGGNMEAWSLDYGLEHHALTMSLSDSQIYCEIGDHMGQLMYTILRNGGYYFVGDAYASGMSLDYSSKEIIYMDFFGGGLDIVPVSNNVPEPSSIYLIFSLGLIGITIRRQSVL